MSGVQAVGSASEVSSEQQAELEQQLEKGIGSLMVALFAGQIGDVAQAFSDDTSTPDS